MEKLYVNVNECECESHSVVSDSLQPYGLYSPWNSPEPFPSPGDLPNTGIKSRSPALQADSLPAEPQGTPNTTSVEYTLDFEGLVPKKVWTIPAVTFLY